MPFVLGENVQETSTTTGTGPKTLAGAVSGAFAFSSQLSNGDTTFAVVTDGVDLEAGVVTYNSAGPTITFSSYYYTTNGGAAVNWTPGTRNVFIGLPGGAIAGLVAPASTGLMVQTGTGAYARRSVAAGTDITVTNGSGVSGDPTIALGFTVSSFIKTLLDDTSVTAARTTLAAAGTAVANTFSSLQTFVLGLLTDAIAERTAGNGVAIDGLTIKDAGFALGSDARGDVYFRDATKLARLPPGTAGQFLKTNGAGADPAWATVTPGVGVSQTWQDLSASRSFGTIYQNTSGAPIAVSVGTSTGNATVTLLAGSTTPPTVQVAQAVYFGVNYNTAFAIIPNNHYYRANSTGALGQWAELR